MWAHMRKDVGQIVFCGGVHGVGKSSLCRVLAPRIGAVHISAGSLLRTAGLASTHGHAVSYVWRNQDYLRDALAAQQRRIGDRPILLDGHFCLLSPLHSIRILPLSLFEWLSPVALLIVVDDPSAIVERLVRRDDAHMDPALIRRL